MLRIGRPSDRMCTHLGLLLWQVARWQGGRERDFTRGTYWEGLRARAGFLGLAGIKTGRAVWRAVVCIAMEVLVCVIASTCLCIGLGSEHGVPTAVLGHQQVVLG